MKEIIIRTDPSKPKAPGTASFIEDGEVVKEFPVITGGSEQLDPEIYAGPLPNGTYIIADYMDKRATKHYNHTCASLIPFGSWWREFRKRTFWGIGVDDFRFHYIDPVTGYSTGCPCVTVWQSLLWIKEWINAEIEEGRVVYVEVEYV